MFTEVVTDPQADHSESAGGNGVLYDATPGTGSVTTSDEYVEIANMGADAVDLTGYSIKFGDTSPSTYVFGTTTTGTLRFSTGSSLTSFAMGGFLVLGNAPGAMNNKIILELFAPGGTVEDRWEILNGNATGLLDESIARPLLGTGDLRAAGTPLMDTFVPNALDQDGATPVPESETWLLVGVIAAGWSLARRRKARSVTSQTHFESQPSPNVLPAIRAGASGSLALRGAPGGSA